MFKSLFRKDPSIEAGEALYGAAVEQARNVVFYERFGVPDSVEGRFEMVALHAWLVLRRLKGGEVAGAQVVSQKFSDAMFTSLDAALREMGVGDLVVSKKIRKLAENFYGRIGAYEGALGLETNAGEDGLDASLARNVYESADGAIATALGLYVRGAAVFLDEQPQSRLVGGLVRFPAPEEFL